MATPVPYRVLVTTDKGMNIILSNKSLENERTYSHFVRAQEAERFADILETLLDKAEYTKLDRCFICGNPFFKEDDICRLINGTEAHNKCFHAMVKKQKLTYDDRTERRANPFPENSRKKDFSNLDSGDKCFRYEIQIVSKTVIHLWLREFYGHQTHHFCMTYDECRGLISAVREKLKAIEKARIGTCIHCSDTIYADQTCYTFASGELIHSKCMEQFVRGEHTGGGKGRALHGGNGMVRNDDRFPVPRLDVIPLIQVHFRIGVAVLIEKRTAAGGSRWIGYILREASPSILIPHG